MYISLFYLLGDKPDPTKSFTVSLSQNLFRTPVVGNTQSVVQSVTVPNESKVIQIIYLYLN